MDSDERDDVPLVRLLRKGLLSNVEHFETFDPVTSVHSHESPSSVDESVEGFFIHRDLASKIINTLTVESRALSTSINLLSDRRLEVDSFVRHLKILIPSPNIRAQDQE